MTRFIASIESRGNAFIGIVTDTRTGESQARGFEMTYPQHAQETADKAAALFNEKGKFIDGYQQVKFNRS